MKKTLLFTALIICTSFAFAQDDDKTFKFGVGGALSLPTGDIKSDFTYGVGVEGTAIYSVTDNIAAFAQAGFAVYKSSDSYAGDAANVLHIPVLVGARFKFSGFFAGAGVGYGRWNGTGDAGGGLLFSPQVGYDFGDYHVLGHYTYNKIPQGNFSYFGLKFFRTF